MLVNVLAIVLKVFWIEAALFWRDMVTPYKTQNGERPLQGSFKREAPVAAGYLSTDIVLLNPISIFFANSSG